MTQAETIVENNKFNNIYALHNDCCKYMVSQEDDHDTGYIIFFFEDGSSVGLSTDGEINLG